MTWGEFGFLANNLNGINSLQTYWTSAAFTTSSSVLWFRPFQLVLDWPHKSLKINRLQTESKSHEDLHVPFDSRRTQDSTLGERGKTYCS